MKIAVRLTIFIVAAAVAFWFWTVLFPSPEKIVLKKVSQLASVVTIKAGDGNITRAAKVSDLLSYFSPDVEISYDVSEAGSHTISSRDELRETAAGAFTQLSSLTVQFRDPIVKMGADGQTATVTCTARVNIADGKEFGIQEVRFAFKKMDHDWLITRVETVKTLQ